MYSTPDDVRGVLSPDGQQDDYETAASFSDEALTAEIKKADARINGYLADRYIVPVDATTYDTDGLLKDWSSVIAAYTATLTYSRGMDISSDDPIRLRFNDVMKMLDRVHSGNLSPNWPGPGNPDAALTIVNRYDGDMFRPEDFDLGYGGGWHFEPGRMPGWL